MSTNATCTTTTVWTLGAEHVVLELHEDVTPSGLALELHVVRLASGRLGAFWLDESGRLLRVVRPAAA